MSAKAWTCLGVSGLVGWAAAYRWPFPDHEPLLQLVLLEKPVLFLVAKGTYLALLFSTPFLLCSVVGSIAYIFTSRPEATTALAKLPPYASPVERDSLYLVLGEVHHEKKPGPARNPRWLTIPSRGLHTGLAVFGAIGSGKTSGCMVPYADQILGYRATDRQKRVGGLILEVKGDFCHKVRALLEKHGRGEDYLEVSLDTPYRYNPLHNDLDAYTLAYGIASLLNNLFGKGREPFWQQAYTNLVKFVILLHKVLDDYVTLFDVYEGVINPDALEKKIKEGEWLSESQVVVIGVDTFMEHKALEAFPFECAAGRMTAPFTAALQRRLNQDGIDYELAATAERPEHAGVWTDEKRQQFEAVKRWF
jgi:hypothetical protein